MGDLVPADSFEIIQTDDASRIRRVYRTRNRLVLTFGTAGAAILFVILGLLSPSKAVIFYGCAVFVFALSPLSWWSVGRELAREPESVMVGPDGVRVRLRSGETLSTTWTDPMFGVTLSERRPLSAAGTVETYLVWQMKGRINPTAILKKGADEIERRAEAIGLLVATTYDRWAKTTTRIRSRRPGV
jgi:hypothetical protein